MKMMTYSLNTHVDTTNDNIACFIRGALCINPSLLPSPLLKISKLRLVNNTRSTEPCLQHLMLIKSWFKLEILNLMAY